MEKKSKTLSGGPKRLLGVQSFLSLGYIRNSPGVKKLFVAGSTTSGQGELCEFIFHLCDGGLVACYHFSWPDYDRDN